MKNFKQNILDYFTGFDVLKYFQNHKIENQIEKIFSEDKLEEKIDELKKQKHAFFYGRAIPTILDIASVGYAIKTGKLPIPAIIIGASECIRCLSYIKFNSFREEYTSFYKMNNRFNHFFKKYKKEDKEKNTNASALVKEEVEKLISAAKNPN